MSNLCALVMSTNSDSQAPALSRTPPFLKWLLNERAAITGDIARLVDLETALALKRDAVSKKLLTAELKLAEAIDKRMKVQVSLDALTRTIEMEYAQANPAAAGVVKARAGKYGAEGSLRTYVTSMIQNAPPGGISTTQLVSSCAQHFKIALWTTAERKGLRFSVKSCIFALRKRGHVASVGNAGLKGAKNWHWTADRVPSFDEMLRVEQEARVNDNLPNPDSA